MKKLLCAATIVITCTTQQSIAAQEQPKNTAWYNQELAHLQANKKLSDLERTVRMLQIYQALQKLEPSLNHDKAVTQLAQLQKHLEHSKKSTTAAASSVAGSIPTSSTSVGADDDYVMVMKE